MKEMLERIAALERTALQLEPGEADRNRLTQAALALGERELESLAEGPAYRVTPDTGAGIRDSPIAEDGMPMEQALALIDEHVFRPGLNPASGGHLGYIPGGGLNLSALGDYLADVSNRYAGVFYAGPGAVRLENMLVRWMADLAGYGDQAAGSLLSGGSLANLTAIVTARDTMGIRAAEIERSVIYLTAHAHHCVLKSVRIAGLGDAQVRHVPLDARFRMRPDALEEQIRADKAAGLRPFLCLASVGTTDAGAVDPADEIGQICEAEGLWFHLDAAYGGFFLLCEEGKDILRGIHRSDSIVMDPHKGLFLPYGTGAVIVKNGQTLIESQHYQANYLLDTLLSNEEPSPADLSPELTRHFRGLRMWLPMKVHGLAPFRAGLAEKLWLARYFYEKLAEIPGMERGPEPELSVVLYRYVPKSGDADDFNARLTEAVRQDGRVFLSSTRIDGRFYLRLAVLSFRTHRHTIDLCLQVLKEKIAELEG